MSEQKLIYVIDDMRMRRRLTHRFPLPITRYTRKHLDGPLTSYPVRYAYRGDACDFCEAGRKTLSQNKYQDRLDKYRRLPVEPLKE